MNTKQAITALREAIRRKHFSYATEKCYVGWNTRYFDAVRVMPADWPAERKIEAFLTKLAKGDCAASTQNQAFDAVRFFYTQVLKRPLKRIDALRAKRAAHVRVAPSPAETMALLNAATDVHGYPTRLITHLLYGCGMRVSEPLNLRIKDVRLADSRLVIRGGKGRKDRVVALPCSLAREISQQIEHARVLWQRDVRNNVPVALPGRLAQKHPNLRFAWQWYWLFPSAKPCLHPRTCELVRWRVHEANVQKCVKRAAAKAGLTGVVTPHVLRHAWATHVLDRGANIRDVQSAMGHAQVNTTMGYCHADGLRVGSPLDFERTSNAEHRTPNIEWRRAA